jgi:hypothetical protein
VRSYFTQAEMATVERAYHVLPHRVYWAPALTSAFKCTADAPAGFSLSLRADVGRGAGEASAVHNAATPAAGDVLATVIWSGKEAALKALREGLRLDTQRIACLFDVAAAASTQDWKPFRIDVDEQLGAQFPGVWSGWWRLHGRHVLTVAVLA